ncbi:MAG: DUF4255 domain-containing protein [Cyanobacteria bacterium RM1_2_2]|nr:DUF4255 domain-containing protein [Cyanobacteria bacterium RM1_2_2]
MLVSVLQSLAEILAGGTSLISTEQIDFSRPGSRRDEGAGPLLNLYFYDIRESKHVQHSGRQVERHAPEGKPYTAKVNWSPNWFDVSLLITAWDRTALSEHHLLTEAMSVLLRHRSLQENFLANDLRGYGNLPLSVAIAPPIEIGALWGALGLPLRPALYLTITVPFAASSSVAPRVWERIIQLQPHWTDAQPTQVLTRRVVIAGMVKSATTAQPLTETTVLIPDTDKRTVSNQEGLFFFEDLHNGNYTLNVQHPGYLSRSCNVLVDDSNTTFKEILLFPVS